MLRDVELWMVGEYVRYVSTCIEV